MASFKITIHTIVTLFISLWTTVARLFTTILHHALPRSATPVLPVAAPHCWPIVSSSASYQAYTKAALNLPTKTVVSSPVPLNSSIPSFWEPHPGYNRRSPRSLRRIEGENRSFPSSRNIMDFHLAMAREVVAKDPVFVGHLPCLPSLSAVPVDFAPTASQERTTPTSSPVRPAKITTPENNLRGESDDHLDDPLFDLDVRKDSPLQVITARMTPCANSANNPSPNSKHFEHSDLLPHSFGSNSISLTSSLHSIMGTSTEVEEFDWPLPPGPLFRFKDEFSAAADYAERVLHRRLDSPVLPLRVVKRNVTPPCIQAPEDPSSVLSEVSEYGHELSVDPDRSGRSMDFHPFLDMSAPHLYSEEIITAAHSRGERQYKLADILSSLPKEDVVAIANLPLGTVISIEQSDVEGNYQLAFPSPESQTLDTETDQPHEESPNMSRASSPSTSSMPTTPFFEHFPPMLQRKEDKHSGPFPIADTIAVLTGEYVRWKTGLLHHDPQFDHMDDYDEHVSGTERWSDVLLLDGYS